MEDFMYLPGNCFIDIHPPMHKDQLRTKAFRLLRGHGRMDTITPGFIAGSSHNSPFLCMTYRQRLATKFRIITLFY